MYGSSTTKRVASSLRSVLLLIGVVALPTVPLYGVLFGYESRDFVDLATVGEYIGLVVLSVGLCIAPLSLLPMRIRTYAAWANGVLIGLMALNLVHVLEYRELITLGAIDAILSTSSFESAEFILARAGSVGWALLTSVGVGLLSFWVLRRMPLGRRPSWRARLVLAACGLAVVGYALQRPVRFFPASGAKNVYDYMQHRQHYTRLLAQRDTFQFDAVRADSLGEGEVYVLVLGETMRRANLPQYGYARNTMPRLSTTEPLIVFEDVTSSATATQAAVKSMLTAAEPATVLEHAEKSIVALAGELGFATYWISNQDRTDDTEVALIADEADAVHFTNHSWSAGRQFDEEVVEVFDRVMAEPAPRKLIVVHLVGSHDQYSRRYPDGYAFYPQDGDPRPSWHERLRPAEQALVDHYDNSIRYTDAVLGALIDRADQANLPALLLYVSDHGENLFDTEDRLMGHGMPNATRYEVEVPLFVWYSEAYGVARADRVSRLSAHRAHPVGASDVFYTLAELLDARFSGMKAERSLAGPAYRVQPRMVLTVEGRVVAVEQLESREDLVQQRVP